MPVAPPRNAQTYDPDHAAAAWRALLMSVKFTLQYDGPLPAGANNGRVSNGRMDKIWAMRRAFEAQLTQLYEISPVLRGHGGVEARAAANIIRTPIRHLDHDWVAIVRPSMKLGCELRISLLLNHDVPSMIDAERGDLDNRVKSVIDALTIPAKQEQLGNRPPEPGEQPFACLMETDALVTAFSVEGRRLLAASDDPQWASIKIDVTVEPTSPEFINHAFR